MWELFTVIKINGQGCFLKFSSDTEDILKEVSSPNALYIKICQEKLHIMNPRTAVLVVETYSTFPCL